MARAMAIIDQTLAETGFPLAEMPVVLRELRILFAL